MERQGLSHLASIVSRMHKWTLGDLPPYYASIPDVVAAHKALEQRLEEIGQAYHRIIIQQEEAEGNLRLYIPCPTEILPLLQKMRLALGFPGSIKLFNSQNKGTCHGISMVWMLPAAFRAWAELAEAWHCFFHTRSKDSDGNGRYLTDAVEAETLDMPIMEMILWTKRMLSPIQQQVSLNPVPGVKGVTPHGLYNPYRLYDGEGCLKATKLVYDY